ncbi:hypothetical protein BUALT_Bualt06G0071900 [Buddleja alternifolia]|uniref:HAT C-terminal dimerisation domain-containing protein n=1 Tax=Buddleja alternifolia TaxID=168488 RepID=A0AAV6XKD6_9LAMI|nr:hypothetical protein BUALT_Bualt06G0071900 [Buddleja alternifolia]
MLVVAIKFKDVFPIFAQRETNFEGCPSEEDWVKVEKVCSVLEVFRTATHIISGIDYPTSNLFLNEVNRVKFILNSKSLDDDYFTILDLRCKMWVVDYFFPQLYPEEEAKTEIELIRRTLCDLYLEYVESHNVEGELSGNDSGGNFSSQVARRSSMTTSDEHDLENDEGDFDVLGWWKTHSLKYKILSTMVKDILAIPIATVASEATFSAGTRVIDKYRASRSLSIDVWRRLVEKTLWSEEKK